VVLSDARTPIRQSFMSYVVKVCDCIFRISGSSAVFELHGFIFRFLFPLYIDSSSDRAMGCFSLAVAVDSEELAVTLPWLSSKGLLSFC